MGSRENTMAQNRLVAVLLSLALVLNLSGCDSTQDLQNQVKQLTQQNEGLQQQVAALVEKTAQYQHAASMYQGCMALDVLSNLCPENIMIEGKKAIDAGFPGGGSLYWFAMAAKLFAFFTAAGLSIFVLWRVFLAWIKPADSEIEEAKQTIEQAEARADQAEARQRAAENEHEKISQQIRSSQSELKNLRKTISQHQDDLAQLDKELEEKRADRDALLGGFL